jgi:FHS family L-fucose permease-like MFS transporter
MSSTLKTPSKNQYLIPFILVTTLFFLWAFLHNINGILIPHLKKALVLSDTQSAFIDTAVYIGYFTIALPAGWFMHKQGYKRGILLGLLLYAAGALLFLPASSDRSFIMFLIALFISASGATFLETVANPYITKLGPKETSEQRLNFAQSFNGVGAVVAPIIGGQFILSGIEHTKAELQNMSPEQLNTYLQTESNAVKIPYLVIGIIVLVVAVCFFVVHIPEIKEVDSKNEKESFSLKIFRHSHVRWAVIAQLFYVGAQVCMNSFFVRFSKQIMNLPEKDAAWRWGYIAMAGFMVGRFAGTFLMKYIKPARLLSIYAVINILLLIVAVSAKGSIAAYSVMAVPFFESIMFPTIFALGIKGLGEETKIASSFLVMSIVGGAIFPLGMGIISDMTGSMQNAYVIPMISFAVVLYFGLRGYKIKTANT